MTECVVIMDDQDVRIEDIDEETEIPAMIDSGFVSAVLKIVDGEIRYAVIDWDEYKISEWKKPEMAEDQS